jgi:hypothetical protein
VVLGETKLTKDWIPHFVTGWFLSVIEKISTPMHL